MKKFFWLTMAFLCTFILTSCSFPVFAPVTPYENLLNESWICKVNLNPNLWLCGADTWFITGKPNKLEKSILRAQPYNAISSMKVRTGNFSKIYINGNFQVQIIGGQEKNSVRVLGPNNAVRMVAVETRNNTLFVRQVPSNDGKCKPDIRKVIVQISACNLSCITTEGNGDIYGRFILSNSLIINSKGNGKIMLSGNMNLCQVNQTGTGPITIMGAYTPLLNIKLIGNGCINISGRVGVKSILNKGDGNITIIGADTDCLTITASGCSKTIVAGYVNLKKIIAVNKSQVYLYWVNGNASYIFENDQARVGLAGTTNNLNVTMKGSTRFYGQYLRADAAYINTSDKSHANVTANKELFAKNTGESSIYYAGSPTLSNTTSGLTTVLPLNGNALPPSPPCSTPLCYPKRRERFDIPVFN